MSRTTPDPADFARMFRLLDDRLTRLEARTQGPRLFGPYTTAPVDITADSFEVVVGFHSLDLEPDSYEVLGMMQSASHLGLMWHLISRDADSASFGLDFATGPRIEGDIVEGARLRFYVCVAAPGDGG